MNVIAIVSAIALAGGTSIAVPEPPPTIDELGNLTYAGIFTAPVELRNGEYLGEPFASDGASRPRVRLARSLHATGDLDGDGIVDAAVLLSHDSGGSGTNLFLAVVTRRNGQLRNVATAALGDRLSVRSMAVGERVMTVDVVTQGATDPMCCPTLKQRWHLHLDRDRLVLDAMETQGQLSLTDLERVTWRLARMGASRPVPDGIRVTAVFAQGQVAGAGGCNRYVGLVTQRGAQLQFGPLGATRMSCPPPADEIESAYFSALGAAESFGFSIGRLAIVYIGANGPDVLLFEPTP